MHSGDIESSPGPRTNVGSDSAKIAEIYEVVKGLEMSQASFLQEIQVVKEQQNALTTSVQALFSRVSLVERDMHSLKQINTPSAAPAPGALDALRHDMVKLRLSLDNESNRSRRSNLTIFGLDDSSDETWSEGKVPSFCQTQLGEQITPESIERAHRLGKFFESKNRPVVTRFVNFKDMERILFRGIKLKG